MNKEWSELNKNMQLQLKKEATFYEGLDTLILLRNELMDEADSFKSQLSRNEFNAIPYINQNGYHNKTIAYSLWHIFRIEDVVAHTLIAGDEQIFFKKKYKERIGSPIITTGNELIKQEIADFSAELNLDELYNYIHEVKKSTEDILRTLEYKQLKRKMTDIDKEKVLHLEVVSPDENACWLVDYWCKRDIKGLIQMPFSRHWIMHIEACCRIKNKIHQVYIIKNTL